MSTLFSRFLTHPERGNETSHRPIAARADSVRGDPPRSGGRAYIEPIGPSPQAKLSVERSISHRLSPAWENCKGGTPFARFFSPFLAGQEMEPPEASRKDLYKLPSVYKNPHGSLRGGTLFFTAKIPPGSSAPPPRRPVPGSSASGFALRRFCRWQPRGSGWRPHGWR